MIVLPIFAFQVFCAWFQCELSSKPPFLNLSGKNNKELLKVIKPPGNSISIEDEIDFENDPIVYTKLGPVLGYKTKINETREIFSFTGVPYGEPPIGSRRFRSPVMRKPWRHIWKATSPSPFCVQANGMTIGMLRGQEDCLYLDVHTPQLTKEPGSPGLPVLIWIPAGANLYGRSMTYGPKYLLREQIIFVMINIRVGVIGFLSTNDEASPGNYALKDQALAVEWVYNNIDAFGGDPNRIVIGGASSGAYAAHAMLFTKHKSRNYIKGIYAMSGSVFGNHGLDGVGRVQNSSNIIARAAGCPTAEDGKSWEMVDCLRKLDPYMLSQFQNTLYTIMPPQAHMLGPTIEPDVPGAFITELPEVLYKRGEVPPIPLIITRTEGETCLVFERLRYVLPVVSLNWNTWGPDLLKLLGVRSDKGVAESDEERQLSLIKITQFYFKKSTPPNFFIRQDFISFVNLLNDVLYFAPMWKAIEYHHKIAPTYSYLMKLKTFLIHRQLRFVQDYIYTSDKEFGASHASDFALLFNNTKAFPPLSSVPEFDLASRNLINLVANFATYGKPLYRTPSGSLIPAWKPITEINPNRELLLEIGLVHNISMIKDPLVNTERIKIWDRVKF